MRECLIIEHFALVTSGWKDVVDKARRRLEEKPVCKSQYIRVNCIPREHVKGTRTRLIEPSKRTLQDRPEATC